MGHRNNVLKYFNAFVMAAGLLSMTRVSLANPLPRLVVARSEEAGDCPDSAALALAVEKLMQHPVFDTVTASQSALVYEVQIDHSTNRYKASIRAGESTRDLSDPGTSCSELAEALALTLAIMLDPDAVTFAPEKPPEVRPPEPTPLPRQTPPPLPPLVMIQPPRPWHIGIAGTVAGTLGFLTPSSLALMPEAFFRYRSTTIGLGAFILPSTNAGVSSSQSVAMKLVTGTLSGCSRVQGKQSEVHFDLCGQWFVGAIHGAGNGFVINREGTRPWVALGSMGMVEGPMFAHFDWSLRFGVTVPIVAQRFTATPSGASGPTVTLFEPPKIASFLAFGIRWTIL